jgi:uncharacterized protein (TIGR01370 family)
MLQFFNGCTMLELNNYILQYSGVDFNAVKAGRPDVFITEGAPVSGTPALTDVQVAQLTAKGTKVFGYVNAAVTDDGRPYWDPSWTSDGTDQGALLASAPSWLRTNAVNPFGFVANIGDPAWQTIVIEQAKDLVRRGYSGVFLDDVAQYFALGQVPGADTTDEWAREMMDLVTDIKVAIKEINPNAELIINGTPYIISDGGRNPTEGDGKHFVESVDAILLEVFFGVSNPPQEAAIQKAAADLAPYMKVLALEYGGTPFQNYLFKQQAEAFGFVAGFAADASYSSFGAPALPATKKADTLLGTLRSDFIDALKGDDTINGNSGDDVLRGNLGNDVVNGDAGRDSISGGKGTDILTGGADSDHFVFVFGDSSRNAEKIDVIKDFTKGDVGVGDSIDFIPALTIGNAVVPATSMTASIDALTGVAIFATGSGTTFKDATLDIAKALHVGGDVKGEFALFQINGGGDYYVYVSDGKNGFSANDVVVKLEGITTIGTISVADGDITLLS